MLHAVRSGSSSSRTRDFKLSSTPIPRLFSQLEMSRVFVHRSECLDSSQAEAKTQGQMAKTDDDKLEVWCTIRPLEGKRY